MAASPGASSPDSSAKIVGWVMATRSVSSFWGITCSSQISRTG